VYLQLPFNTTALSKENRQSIEKAVKEAKRWPDVGIQAIVIAGAYIGERDLDVLQDRRGEVSKAYLRNLGIAGKDIYVEPKTLTEVFARKLPDGTTHVDQIEIELSPLCKDGDCRWMCDDPRLWPNPRPPEMSEKQKIRCRAVIAALAVSAFLNGSAGACTIGEEAEIELPLNTTELTNANRLAIADAVIEARKWPDVRIQAVIMAGAYTVERNLDWLKEDRARNVMVYLQQLGIRSEDVLIEKHTFTDEMVAKRPDGTPGYRQVFIEFKPICKDSCAWMCNDPRVTPRTRVINP